MVNDLARDTAVARLASAPGWFTAELPDHWNFRTPSGGVLMTIALRAMGEELGDPELRVVSANTLFCSPVPNGPLEIRVEVLRKGNAAAQLRAALSSTTMPGPGLEVSATFAREREGPNLLDSSAPAVPRPEACPPLLEPMKYPFFRNFDMRIGHGQAWWEPSFHAGPEARFGRWIRYQTPQNTPDGMLDMLALPPVIDLMPTALIQKLGPNAPRLHAPSLDLTVHFLEPSRTEWLLTHSHVRRARAGYASADVEVWDDHGTLIAFATQTMMLRRRPPADP